MVGPWSFYFNGDGLNDRGWRYQSPSTIGRIYSDVATAASIRIPPDRQLRRTFFGAAAATPVDFTHLDPRAIFTYPQTTTTQLGTLQLTGRVDISPTWDLAGNAYFRRFSQQYIDGNDAEFERCGATCSTPDALRFDDDGFPASPSTSCGCEAPTGRSSPSPGASPRHPRRDADRGDRLRRLASGGNRDRVLGFGNSFVVGGSIDVADYAYKSSSTLGVINPDLSVTRTRTTRPTG